MDRKDWASVTDEVIMDLERYGLKARKNHPNPIGLLIAEIKRLRADVERLREKVEFSHLKDWAIMQAEHMRAKVGDNTWHYAMEVWLYPETHYWEYDEEETVKLIERYITTNRDAWVKHWGEPSEVARKRCEE